MNQGSVERIVIRFVVNVDAQKYSNLVLIHPEALFVMRIVMSAIVPQHRWLVQEISSAPLDPVRREL